MASFDTTDVLPMLETSADRLRRSLADLDDDRVAAASALPEWSRAHVLTHLARNADALINLLTWARTGQPTPMYPSREVRNAEIAEGALRPADAQRADVEASQARFMGVAAELTDADWGSTIRWGSDDQEGTADVVPWLRLVEVEVHHVDLDLGYTPAHWSTPFVRAQLVRTVEDRARRVDTPAMSLTATDDDVRHVLGDGSGPTVSGSQAALLAWLLGRSDGHDLVIHGDGVLPGLAPWR
ncbi:MAG: maleylpyruvate isomerase family mycothiol-dependent enzyme [Nocardioidaceae bacterium]